MSFEDSYPNYVLTLLYVNFFRIYSVIMGNKLSMATRFLSDNPLAKAAAFDFGLQWAAFVVAYAMKTEKFYDLVGSSTFLGLTWLTLTWGRRGNLPFFDRQVMQNSCVSLWAARLGMYLFSRVMASGEDRRFRKAKESPSMFLMFWTIQGLWVWLTLLPTMILNLKQKDKELNYRDYLGFSLFAVGFMIEAVADYQKSKFRSDPANKNKFVNTGLWSVSRHPNYLGEILLWSGLFLPASNVMEGKELLSVLSPLFVTYLLTNVSGIPILERYADRKWGGMVEYQNYKRTTSKLFPYIW